MSRCVVGFPIATVWEQAKLERPNLWLEAWSNAQVSPVTREQAREAGDSAQPHDQWVNYHVSMGTPLQTLNTKFFGDNKSPHHTAVTLLLKRLMTYKFHIWDPPEFYPIRLFFWMVLDCFLYDKTGIISLEPSWILWVVLVNYKTPGNGGSLIWSQSVRMTRGRGTELSLLSTGGWSCWKQPSILWNLCWLRHIASESYCQGCHMPSIWDTDDVEFPLYAVNTIG